MYHFLNRPDIYNLPIRLSKKDKEGPVNVFSEYFCDYELCDVRQHLWLLLEIALTAPDEVFSEPTDRADLLTFYKRTEELIEATFIIVSQQKAKD
jgi:hypothetical protein